MSLSFAEGGRDAFELLLPTEDCLSQPASLAKPTRLSRRTDRRCFDRTASLGDDERRRRFRNAIRCGPREAAAAQCNQGTYPPSRLLYDAKSSPAGVDALVNTNVPLKSLSYTVMSDEAQEPRATIADLRSRFEALAADQKSSTSIGRSAVPTRPSGLNSGNGAQSISTPTSRHSSGRGTPAPLPQTDDGVSRSTSVVSNIPTISLSDTDASEPAAASGEQATYGNKGWITNSPITLSPSLLATDLEPQDKSQNADSAISGSADEDFVTSEKLSVADLRSRFGGTNSARTDSGARFGVGSKPSSRPPSRPDSPVPHATSAHKGNSGTAGTPPPPSETIARVATRQSPPPIPTTSPSPQPEGRAEVKVKPPPPPVPPKSRNISTADEAPAAAEESGLDDSARAESSGQGKVATAILPEPFSLDQKATLPPPLPGRPVLPEGESNPPKLPERARTVATSGATAQKDIPQLPPRQTANATLRAPDNVGGAGLRGRAASISNPLNMDDQEYRPPPPPSRHATPSGSPQMPSRVKKQNSQDANSSDPGDEEDEGEEPHGLRTTMSTSAKRALEEYPDSSRAHRRAPDFVPRQFITNHHNIHAYTVCGHRLCIVSHKLKVYDLTLGDAQPIVTFDPKSLGIESRSKEHKLTAVSFRALATGMEEGRYIWCGSNLGHLVEVDTTTGEVTQTRMGIHGSTITHIFRYREYMLSLEENGKMHVFGPFGDTAVDGGMKHMTPWRTIRTAEKTNFVRMLGDQVWTSSGPATRSTTNPALRGPTIRVYEPLGVGTANTSGRTTYTSEWTGAVTAAAILASTTHEVYLAHEGGYVSVFDRETLACKSVLKVSSSDILALEGVGDRLWAGYRTGMVNVYDVTTMPWTTTNMWLAHPYVVTICC